MRLLFEEAIPMCFKPPEERLKKLNTWVQNANIARNLTKPNLEAFQNQYDKAEELITFYTFAPLALSQDRVSLINHVLSLAKVKASTSSVVDLALERQYEAPRGYVEWIRQEVKKHPVRYIREQAVRHQPNQRLESNSHIDAFIETDNLLIFFELKFTSDIAHETTFNPSRNQLARIVDVALEANKTKDKQVLIILSTPRSLFDKKNRLYYYKIQEYENLSSVAQDIEWRNPSDVTKNLLGVRWVALEDLIQVIYKDFTHYDRDEALEFFKERCLSTDAK